jgi:hypothetical protein
MFYWEGNLTLAGWRMRRSPASFGVTFSKIITASERLRTLCFYPQMNSRNSRIVHNRLASQLLYRLLDWRKWDELKLAEVSGILPSVISAHLSGQRPIRPQHLGAYLRVLDRHERSALLDAWLQDNVDCEVIANLLDGTKTDSMRSVEANRWRMLDWWAMAIARDSKIAKIFRRFRPKAAFKFPLELLSLVSTAAVQFQGWLLEKACSLFTRVKHATVALVTLVLALCQQGKVPQQAGELAEQGSELAEKTLASSVFATPFVAPALAETTNFNFDLRDPSPPVDSRQNGVASRVAVKGGKRRSPPQHQVAPALRIQRTIGHEWHRLVTARKNVHSAFARLISDAYRQQSKQTHRKQRRS